VADIATFQWPALFDAAKDRPILFTAVVFSDVLLILDRVDFGAPSCEPASMGRRCSRQESSFVASAAKVA